LDPEQAANGSVVQRVSKLLFLERGDAHQANAGGGFLVDSVGPSSR
jgi:hypothetical protein